VNLKYYKGESIGHTSKKVEVIVTLDAKSIICPKPKLTQLSKDQANKLVGILAQEHFPSSTVKMHDMDGHQSNQ
jgi:hypothetical protein